MINTTKDYKIFFHLLIVCVLGVLMAGCSSKTLKEQQKDCEIEGKKFTINSQFDFTTGKIGPKGNCN